MIRLGRAARAVVLGAVALAASPAVDTAQEPRRLRGSYNNAVHRFFPDLDSRLNAVRYGRWRAAEIAWMVGINRQLDQEFSAYLLGLLAEPPRYPPEAELVAPRLAREAGGVFRALRWGQVLEQQVGDVLASPDAIPEKTSERLRRVLDAHRRERWALSEPSDVFPPSEALALAPDSARLLLAGTRLFVRAAEALVGTDFGQQRWAVRDTIAEFDGTLAAARTPEEATYRVSAPAFSERYPAVAAQLDRIARFRGEIYGALVRGGATSDARAERDARVRDVARRYGVPFEDVDAE